MVRKGVVEDVMENVYCTVNFLDYSTSFDLFLSDLKKCECQYFNCRGSHFPGALVTFLRKDFLYFCIKLLNKFIGLRKMAR